jgi:hypothetical protein
METLCAYAPFVFAELPVGDPLRASLADAHAQALARLANPAMLIDAGNAYIDDEQRAGVEALINSLGGTPIAGLTEATARDVPGAIIVTTTYGTNNENLRVRLRVRPATLDARALASIGKLATLTREYNDPLEWLAYLRGDELAAMIARIRETPVPAGGWEQNPLASASKIVDKVAKNAKVSRDAAALYLQYLVLLWPTAKNLNVWNGWKPKQLEAATDELVEEELILEAKRERAQRAYFLPGGWEALKSPHPPLETWKLPFYGTRTPEGQVSPHGERFAARAPFHLLFERAWKRLDDGDVPKYDEVKRR